MNVFFLPSHRSRCLPAVLVSLLFSVLLACLQTPRVTAAPAQVRLRGHVPAAVMRAHPMGLLPGGMPLSLSLALPLRDRGGLEVLLDRVYNPADPLYQHYLTPAEFTARFGPTQASYDAVAAFARSRGLTVTKTSPGRLLLSVSGSAATVEAAFGVRLRRYQGADGRVFHAPDVNPAIPASLAGRISAVIGLDNAGVWRSHAIKHQAAPRFTLKQAPVPGGAAQPAEIGTDPFTGISALQPSDIKAAYGLTQTPLTGAGQTLGLLELDGYAPSDIATYNASFGLPNVPLENVLLDGFDGSVGPNAGEVTLDIEVMNALAPGASKILVYESPNSAAAILDIYNKMADDDRANQLSSSWGIHSENQAASIQDTENVIFQKMAAQGQSFFVITGDFGAYDDGAHLSVEDPSTQPFVTAVGGTKLAVTAPGGAYRSEGAWGNTNQAGFSNPLGAGGGGGVSDIWPIPSYQIGVTGLASTTLRNTPDVSLDADPDTGYAIYLGGSWTVFGGTSVATPLWAAFAALVNQQRALYGEKPLGFANPLIYTIGKNAAQYASGFHDPADGSTNLFYPATPGYDNATGWGSFNGTNMLALLAPPLTPNNPVAGLKLTPETVVGGLAVTGTVTLANPAPGGGATVTLSTTDAGTAPVPTTIVVPAGGTSADFTFNTAVIKAQTTVTIKAAYGGGFLTASLVVLPPPAAIVPTTLTFSPDSVNGGDSSVATVTLTGPAPAGGLSVALSSSDPAAQVPASVTVPAGTVSATFPVTTSAVLKQVIATITATANGKSATGTLTVLAPTLQKLVLTPPRVPGGQSSVGTLTLTFAAPKGGATVALSSSDPAAQVPATALIAGGATTATFTVTTKAVPTTVIATIKATYAGLDQTATLSVQSARILSVSTAPSSVTGGSPSVGTVTLDSPVIVPAGLVVTLSGNSPAGAVPATVTVPAGSATATFPIPTAIVAAPIAETITGTLDSISKTALLSIQPIQILSLSLSPAQVVVGGTSVGTVTVNAPAPAGGLAVALSSAGTAEAIPSGALVPAGATSVTFPITAPTPGSATVAAVVGGQTRTATLVVTLAPGTSYPAGLNMISAPYDYTGQPLDGLFGYTGVRLATWMPDGGAYAFTAAAPADTLHLGRGYWIRLPKAVTLSRPGTPADPAADFSIPLSAGWNQIGDPFLVPIKLGGVRVSVGGAVFPFAQATSATPALVSELVYSYSPTANAGKGDYVWTRTDSSLQPGLGYWVYSYEAATLVIPHPGQ